MIYNKAGLLISGIDVLIRTERLLSSLLTFKTGFSAVVPLVAKLPYIGPIIRTIWNLAKPAFTKVEVAKDKLNRVTNKISSLGLKVKMESLQTKLNSVQGIIDILDPLSPIIVAAAAREYHCPPGIPSAPCAALNTVVGEIATVLSQIQAALNTYKDVFDPLFKLLDLVNVFSDLMNPITPIMDVLNVAFAAIEKALGHVFRVEIPW